MEKKRILFIEDESYRNKAMYDMLRFDYEVDWAKTPKEAYQFLSNDKNKYDLILLDIMLPVDEVFTIEEKLQCKYGDDTGLVLAKRFGTDEKTKNIPIIFESARNQIDISNFFTVRKSIVKPFYYQDLKKEIDKIFK